MDAVKDRKESSGESMGDVGKLSSLLLASESVDHRLDGARGSRHEYLREEEAELTSDDLHGNTDLVRLPSKTCTEKNSQSTRHSEEQRYAFDHQHPLRFGWARHSRS